MKNQIFKLLLGNKTLVFTSEVVARNVLSSFLIANENTVVFKDRCISFDNFYLSLLNTGDKKQIRKEERMTFSYSFLSSNIDRLSYFASPLHKESLISYASSLSSLLPFFSNTEGIEKKALDDIKIIKPIYDEYLEKNNLYEKNFLTPEIEKIEKGKYVFIFPETFNNKWAMEIVNKGLVDSLSVPKVATPQILSYKNSISEIKALFRKIYKDLETCSYSDIAITSSSLNTYRPFLERESKLKDIPLLFTSTTPLSSYSESRFFSSLYNWYNSDYSLKETKELFLDPTYPFKDRQQLRDIISRAIERRILKDGGIENWKEVLKNEQFSYLEKLINATKKIIVSTRPNVMINAINDFRDNFFDSSWDRNTNKIFGTLVDILEKMGKEEIKDSFLVFLSLIEQSSYVEKTENKEGIKVYSYPSSCGIIAKKHYLIGLDDKSTTLSITSAPFINDDKTDLTSSLLSVYSIQSFQDELIVSGSTLGFDGARLLPPFFLTNVKKIEIIESDQYSEERKMWHEGKEPLLSPTLFQSLSYFNAKNNILRGRKNDVEVEQFTEEKLEMSVSNAKKFDECPYKGYASFRLKLRRKDFDTILDDATEIGNILHEAVQEELDNSRSLTLISVPNLKEKFKVKLKNSKKIKSKAIKYYLFEKFNFNKLINKDISACGDMKLLGNELEVADYPLIKNITIKGRIDSLFKNEEGKYLIIDWKKNGSNDYSNKSIDDVSLQLVLYSMLLEKGEVEKMEEENFANGSIICAAFYSFESDKYFFVWSPLLDEKNKEYDIELVYSNAEKRLKMIQNNLDSGSFTPKYSEKGCMNCEYKGLCREQFNVRMDEVRND